MLPKFCSTLSLNITISSFFASVFVKISDAVTQKQMHFSYNERLLKLQVIVAINTFLSKCLKDTLEQRVWLEMYCQQVLSLNICFVFRLPNCEKPFSCSRQTHQWELLSNSIPPWKHTQETHIFALKLTLFPAFLGIKQWSDTTHVTHCERQLIS